MLDFINNKPSLRFEMADGAVWRAYEDDPTGSFAITTASGQHLVGDHNEFQRLKRLFARYRRSEVGRAGHGAGSDSMRVELGRGQQAVVYSMAKYAVRETLGVSDLYKAVSQLEPLDTINQIAEEGCPRWLNVPRYYGTLADLGAQKTYTLMDRINCGVTVEDVIDYPDIPEARARLVTEEFGKKIGKAQLNARRLFELAGKILTDEINNRGIRKGEVLTDWHPRNALFKKVTGAPVAGSKYKIYIIDQ